MRAQPSWQEVGDVIGRVTGDIQDLDAQSAPGDGLALCNVVGDLVQRRVVRAVDGDVATLPCPQATDVIEVVMGH